jgi:predicted ATPase
MIHLRSVSVNKTAARGDKFPFSVPIIKSLTEIEFSSEVTFLVGENGSGKSTFLEGIAAAAGSITVGSEGADGDPTLRDIRTLAKALKLTWSKRTRTGFFLRSEDFFGFVKRMARTREELLKDLQAVDEDYKDRSDYARGLARMPYARELNEMRRYYGEDLDAYSHGESYFTLFKSRFVPNGLYLLDEPEAPLSPLRQIIFLSMLKMMIGQNAQFIIATHSPIILAYPGAVILSFDGGKIQPVPYDHLDHVRVTKSFLDDPEQYLKRMFEEIEEGTDRPST